MLRRHPADAACRSSRLPGEDPLPQCSRHPQPSPARHVCYLGSPHLGAPLARTAGLAGWALGQMPGARPFASLAAGPASVKDLRHGYLLDDDWTSCDQDCCLRDHRGDVPLLAGANHYAISATVTADPASPADGCGQTAARRC